MNLNKCIGAVKELLDIIEFMGIKLQESLYKDLDMVPTNEELNSQFAKLQEFLKSKEY